MSRQPVEVGLRAAIDQMRAALDQAVRMRAVAQEEAVFERDLRRRLLAALRTLVSYPDAKTVRASARSAIESAERRDRELCARSDWLAG